MVVVGLLVVFALARPLGDFVRVVYPLSYFGYTTNGDAIVTRAPAIAPGSATRKAPRRRGAAKADGPPQLSAASVDVMRAGDRVRIDRINPLERKPGLAGGRSYTYDNLDRWLPIERDGRERVMHLVAKQESVQARFTELLRIVLCVVAAGLGAMLFLVRPASRRRRSSCSRSPRWTRPRRGSTSSSRCRGDPFQRGSRIRSTAS